MSIANVISIIALIVAVGGLMLQYYGVILKMKEDIAGMRSKCNPEQRAKDFSNLVSEVTQLSVKVAPFWEVVSTHIPQLLKMPHTLRKDDLLQKMVDRTLTYDEAVELQSLLDKEGTEQSKELQLAYKFALSLLNGKLSGGKDGWQL